MYRRFRKQFTRVVVFFQWILYRNWNKTLALRNKWAFTVPVFFFPGDLAVRCLVPAGRLVLTSFDQRLVAWETLWRTCVTGMFSSQQKKTIGEHSFASLKLTLDIPFTKINTRCQHWHFRGMLWPHLFPLYASHIFKAIFLRYGVHEIIPEISFRPGHDPGQIHIWGLFIFPITLLEIIPEIVFWWLDADYIIEKRTRINYTETVSSRIFILFPQGKTQSASENAISPPCTVQFPPFILPSSP